MLKQESRNKMTFERIKYYRHLFGGALECIQSRLSKNPKPLCFSLMVTSKCNCDCDFVVLFDSFNDFFISSI